MKKIQLFFLLLACWLTGYSQPQTVGLFQNDSLAFNGYTLFSNSTITYLIDNCGYTVHTWESEYNPGSSVYLLENGNLLRSARIFGSFQGGGIGGRIELFNWEGNLLWSYNYANQQMHQHHDIEPLPNGNFLLIAWELKTHEEAITAGMDPNLIPFNELWSEQVVEIEMAGINEINILWEWHLWDHLIQDFDPGKDNYGIVADHPELLNINAATIPGAVSDWIHMNAIQYNPELDQIVLSSRHLSEIWIIDHSTNSVEAAGHSGGKSGKGGDFLYRWGNPQHYNRGIAEDQILFGQHDVRWVPAGYPNEGKLMVFNNGQGRPEGNYSSVDIWELPIDENGNYAIEPEQPFEPENLIWTYSEPGFYSSRISGAQPLPNGNILICDGRDGRFFEITDNQEHVWEYVNPVSNGNPVSQGGNPFNNDTFRATRFPTDYMAFNNKNLTPGDPIELNPLPIECMIYEETTPTNNPFILDGVHIRQNPFHAKLTIENEPGEKLIIQVIALNGHLTASFISSNPIVIIPSINWPKGIYVVRAFDEMGTRSFAHKVVKY